LTRDPRIDQLCSLSHGVRQVCLSVGVGVRSGCPWSFVVGWSSLVVGCRWSLVVGCRTCGHALSLWRRGCSWAAMTVMPFGRAVIGPGTPTGDQATNIPRINNTPNAVRRDSLPAPVYVQQVYGRSLYGRCTARSTYGGQQPVVRTEGSSPEYVRQVYAGVRTAGVPRSVD